jgi:hypothetical protein
VADVLLLAPRPALLDAGAVGRGAASAGRRRCCSCPSRS